MAVEEKAYCPYCMAQVNPGESCSQCGLTAGTYTPAPHHLPPQTALVDRYLIGRVLGEGGFGITYIGCDLRLELRVAIKEYYPATLVSRRAEESLCVRPYAGMEGSFEKGRLRFLTEARAMAKMDKTPEIVSVRDFFEENNTAYIVMEYLDGTTFKELVRQKGGRIEAEELLRLIEPLFGALSAMHEKGLIHRDISPDNLMLEHGAVRLLDFGCARESLAGNETMTITLKHGYAPIEQYQRKGQGPWTDVYALSATIYYCLTGKVPPQALDRMVEDELISPRKLGVRITAQQERALLRGMSLRQHQRFRSMEELHAALYVPEPEPGPEPVPPGPTPIPDPPKPDPDPPKPDPVPLPGPQPSWRRWAPLAGAGAAVVALTILAALLLPGGETPASTQAPTDAAQPTAAVQPTDAAQPTAAVQPTDAAQDAGDPFASAQRLGAQTGEAELRAALADESVPAVVLSAGCDIGVTEGPLSIDKPVRIEAGAHLYPLQTLTVEAGGSLRVEGSLETDIGIVRVCAGGEISVGEGGILTGGTAMVLEGTDGFTVEPGGTAEMGGTLYGAEGSGAHFLEVGLDFAQAERVTSSAELRDALEAGAGAIAVEGDILLRGGEALTVGVPLLVPEGSSLTTAQGAQTAVLTLEGGLLLNRGEVQCVVHTVDGPRASAVVNYGTLRGGFSLMAPESALVNFGAIELAGGAQQVHGEFYNLGEIRLGDSDGQTALDLLGGPASNAGTIEIPQDCRLTVCCDRFGNEGTISASAGGTIQLDAQVLNAGDFLVDSGGTLGNTGYIETVNAAARFAVEEGAQLQNDGLLLVGSGNALSLPAEGDAVYTGFLRTFRWDENESARLVATEAELREALEDPVCEQILVNGELDVQGDLTVNKVLNAGNLRLHGGTLTLSGESALFFGTADLDGGALRVEQGAVAAMLDLHNCASLTVEDSALAVLWNSELGGCAVQLGEGGGCIALNGLWLEGSQVSVEAGAVLRARNALEASGARLEIAEGGTCTLRNAEIFLDSETRVENDGALEWGANTSLRRAVVEGEVDNAGVLTVEVPMDLSGALRNAGEAVFYHDVTLTGTLDNAGQLYLSSCRIAVEAGGALLGEEPQQVSGRVDLQGREAE